MIYYDPLYFDNGLYFTANRITVTRVLSKKKKIKKYLHTPFRLCLYSQYLFQIIYFVRRVTYEYFRSFEVRTRSY